MTSRIMLFDLDGTLTDPRSGIVSDHFAEVFKSEGRDIPVTLLPGVGHISLTLEHVAVQAAVAAARSMNKLRA